MCIQPGNNKFASKTSYGSKNATAHIFISNRINSELFKGIYRPVLLKRKNLEVVLQDYSAPVSLKSGNFVLFCTPTKVLNTHMISTMLALQDYIIG